MACVVAAMVWTYWLAPQILAVTVLFLLAFGVWYLKRVVEPRVLRSDLAQTTTLGEPLTRPSIRASYRSSSTGASGRPSRPSPYGGGPEDPAG